MNEYSNFTIETKKIEDFKNEIKILREAFEKKQKEFENEKKLQSERKEKLLKELKDIEVTEN